MRNSLLWRLLTFIPRKIVDGVNRVDFISRGLAKAFPNSRLLNGLFKLDEFLYGLVFGSKAKERRIEKAQARHAKHQQRHAAEQRRETPQGDHRRQERQAEVQAAEAEIPRLPAHAERPTQRAQAVEGGQRVRAQPAAAQEGPAMGQAPVREALGVRGQPIPAPQRESEPSGLTL